MAEKKEIRLPRWEGKEYYPATTTEAVADRQRKKALDAILTDIDKAVETKAVKDGYEPKLKVRYSEELVGRGEAVSQEIGKMRPTGEISIGDGNATITEMRGKSVVWNQWAKIGVKDFSAREFFVFLSESVKLKTNHKYLIVWDIVSEYEGKYDTAFYFNGTLIVPHIYKVKVKSGRNVFPLFYTPTTASKDALIYCYPWYNGQGTGDADAVGRLLVSGSIHDLTQMFGAGNEPTTIEEFEARKPLGVTNAYNEGEIVSFDAQALKSVGFNAWNGEYAKVIGGMEYRLEGAFTSIGFAKELGGEKTAITVAGDRVYTPSENGYIYAKGTDVCIHLKHTYTPERHKMEYEEDVLELPDIKGIMDKDGNALFPYGLLSDRNVHDEITATKAVKRVGRRAYATGDESNASVVTDGTSTQYALSTPIEVDLPEPLNLSYEAWDFGTEELVAEGATTQLNADIAYQFNAVDRIRENSAYKADKTEVEKIEKRVEALMSLHELEELAFYIDINTASALGSTRVDVGGNMNMRAMWENAKKPILMDRDGNYIELNPSDCRYTAEGEYLLKEDGTIIDKYSHCDMMELIPEYYGYVQTVTVGETTKLLPWFSLVPLPGGYVIPQQVVGKFKSCNVGSEMRSLPGLVPDNTKTINAFWNLAQARSKSHGLANLDFRNYMLFHVMSKYGYRDVQNAVGGDGTKVFGVGLDGTESKGSDKFTDQRYIKTGSTLTLGDNDGNVPVTDNNGDRKSVV